MNHESTNQVKILSEVPKDGSVPVVCHFSGILTGTGRGLESKSFIQLAYGQSAKVFANVS